MSTTDQILGNRDTQFMTSGQPKGMSTRYYTLTDTSKKPPIIEIKERSPLGNIFDRTVGKSQGGNYTNVKGNTAEEAFFSNKKGHKQALDAAISSSEEDLNANINSYFEGSQGNPQLTRKLVNDAFKSNIGTDSGIDSVTVSSVSVADIQKTPPDAAGTRTNFGGLRPIVFPVAIHRTQDIIKFSMMKYTPKELTFGAGKKFGISERDRTLKDIIGSVVLPIPGGIQDNNQVSWGQDSMNAVDVELANIALEGIRKGGGAAVDAALNAADRVASASGEAGTALANQLAGMASGNQNLLQRTTGAILNPNMELLFNAPVLRPFSFSFQLSPRSEEEAQRVIKIIRFFKQGMAPIRSKSNLFLKSPHTFQLAYKYRGGPNPEKDHPYLNRFKECALQGFGVQYTPSGNYSTFSDGVMQSYQISMQFTELEPVFNDDYETSGIGRDEIGY